MNWWLLTAVVFLAVLFKSSSSLAAAYGIAVTGDMVITACLVFVVAWRFWRWPPAVAALVLAPFLLVELVFLSANALKIVHGGWVPLTIGAALVTAMWTWRRGSALIAAHIHEHRVPLADFTRMAETGSVLRAPGTAVFLTGSPDDAPGALMHNVKHNHVLHERNLILTVVTEEVPRVYEAGRVTVERLSDVFTGVTVRFGFTELPDLPRALANAGLDEDGLSYFLSRRVLVASPTTACRSGRTGSTSRWRWRRRTPPASSASRPNGRSRSAPASTSDPSCPPNDPLGVNSRIESVQTRPIVWANPTRTREETGWFAATRRAGRRCMVRLGMHGVRPPPSHVQPGCGPIRRRSCSAANTWA